MQVVLGSRQEIVVQIFSRGWSPWKLFLHDRDQLAAYLVDFVSREKIGDLAGGQKVVQIFEEAFFLDLLVCEDEGDSLPLHSSHSVQVLEVLHKIGHVVRSGRFYEGLMSSRIA